MTDSKKAYLTTYLILTTLASFLFCFISKPQGGGDIGFFTRLFAALLAIPTGFIGALIGDFIRRLVIPDVIFTTGGFLSILKARFFWFCVPQLIGMFIGIALVASQILPKRVERVEAPAARSQVAERPRSEPSTRNANAPSQLEDRVRIEPFNSNVNAGRSKVEDRVLDFLKTGEDADARARRAILPDRDGEIIRDDALILALDNLPSIGGSLQFLRSANGGGVISNISKAEKFISLFSLNPNRGSTCEFAGPGRRSNQGYITAEKDDCTLTLTRKAEKMIVTGQCAAACGMGATLEDEYILSGETFVKETGIDPQHPVYVVTTGMRTAFAE